MTAVYVGRLRGVVVARIPDQEGKRCEIGAEIARLKKEREGLRFTREEQTEEKAS